MMRNVLIVGAGPAGLTAALELARRSSLHPVIVEALDDVGGLSRTVEYKGNRMDIGGHRFFSKSDWVMDWCKAILPIASNLDPAGPGPAEPSPPKMLVRPRLSRIYFMRRFFDYPISLSLRTLKNLGAWRAARIGFSYAWSRLVPRSPERNLEDFFVFVRHLKEKQVGELFEVVAVADAVVAQGVAACRP